MSSSHSGSCHCGAITATFDTSLELEAIHPRACGCTFCVKHKPAWFADNYGKLSLDCTIEPTRYRFGTKTADFILCPKCGVVVAATCAIDGSDYAVFNLNVLDVERDWAASAQPVDFDGEGTGDRLSRRAKSWMPVTLTVAS